MSPSSDGERIGVWRCPSRNTCEVTFRRDDDGIEHVAFAWDRLPLSAGDVRFYRLVIRPQTLRRVKEFTERLGRALLVELV